jgi:hypothetical protein
MPPRRKATPAVAEQPTVTDRVRVTTPPPVTAVATADAEYDPFVNYSTSSEYTPQEHTSSETPVYKGYAYNYNTAPVESTASYTQPPAVAKTETATYNAGYNPNAYNPNSYNPNAYNPSAYNPNAYNPNAYNPSTAYTPAPAQAEVRYTADDNSYARRRSPPRRSRSPGRRSRSPSPRRRRSPSPPRNRDRDRVRRAPAIPTVVALDLLTWIPAHIWREHGYQPPVKLK